MDIQNQTALATRTQVSGTDGSSAKKGPVQALSGFGGNSDEGGASFGKLLVQTIGTGSAPIEAAAALSAVQLLDAVPLALPAASSSQDGSAQQILQAFAEHPELADSLKGDENFEEWLVRVSELLQGMLLLPQPTVQTPETGAVVSADATSGKETVRLQPAIQAQQVITALQQAVSEHPDSILLTQLTDDLKKLVADRLQDAPVPVKETADFVQKNENRTQIRAAETFKQGDQPLNASVPEKEQAATVHPNRDHAQAQARVASAAGLADAGLQTVSGDSHTLHLEILAAKANLIDRFSKDKGQQESDANSSGQNEISAQTQTGPTTVQELLKLAQPGKSASLTVASTPETLVQDLSRFVTARFKVNDLNGLAEARLTLTPESLGQVDVKISMQNGQLVAHFAAQTATGKEMLEAQLMSLRTALQNQGIQVEKLEVTQNGFLQSGFFQEQRNQHSQQFTRRNKQQSNEQFQDTYNTEALNSLSAYSTADRTGFDATV